VVHSVTPVTSALDAVAWLSAVALIGLCVITVRLRGKSPLLVFGVAWFLLFLLPSSAVALAEHMAEHRVYESSVGFFLLCGLFAQRIEPRAPRALPAALGVVALIFGGATVMRNRVWSDPLALWREASHRAPDVWAARYAYGDALREHGDCPAAIVEYRAAIDRWSAEPRAHENLAICLSSLHRTEEARREFDEALRLDPRNAGFLNNLGVFEASLDHRAEARRRFNEALELAADDVRARQHLVELDQADPAQRGEAERLCAELRRLAPDLRPQGCAVR
jgi:tetratricopeptide (TPR) repeat protein